MNPQNIPESQNKKEEIEEDDEETLLSYRYLLGEMGIQMLIAILRGASTKQSIQLLSGVPMACVKGRMPVLSNLKLIYSINNDEIRITEKGERFLKLLQYH